MSKCELKYTHNNETSEGTLYVIWQTLVTCVDINFLFVIPKHTDIIGFACNTWFYKVIHNFFKLFCVVMVLSLILSML